MNAPQDERLAGVETVTIPLETLRHLFDLAVDTPLVCSGSFDTDDVNVLRDTASVIGADPEAITPDEFITQYPHTFKPRRVSERTWPVFEYADGAGVLHAEHKPGWRSVARDETPEETAARVAEERADLGCQAGPYGRRCGLLADDEKHTGGPS